MAASRAPTVHDAVVQTQRARVARRLASETRTRPAACRDCPPRGRPSESTRRSVAAAVDGGVLVADVAACGSANGAAYGACVASSYQRLLLSSLPTPESPAYPGLPFPVLVTKVDAYNQTISTDSASVVHSHSASSAAVADASAATLQAGQASLDVVLRPLYSLDSGAALPPGGPQVVVQSIDAQADGTSGAVEMASDASPVYMARGAAVCPAGYILVLDPPVPPPAYSPAACVQCGQGTYSVSPLAGTQAPKPSCFNCPAGASACPGGAVVHFALGTWVVAGGMYRLVACPGGHELVAAVGGGTFSHDAQQCAPCRPTQYSLTASRSRQACHDCPVGAACNGSALTGLVPGSVWAADKDSGQCVLLSCPAGYSLTNTLGNGDFSFLNQACTLCPASYYCPGAGATAVACPQGQFAPPGANGSAACADAVFLSVSVTLPMAAAAFTATKQRTFAAALAVACGQRAGRVVVQSVRALPAGRAVAGDAIAVQSLVALKDAGEAAAVRGRLDAAILNSELASQGLPPAAVLGVELVQPLAIGGGGDQGPWVLVGCLVAGVGLAMAAGAGYLAWSRGARSAEERVLEREVRLLRGRLGITQKDGFMLRSPIPPPALNTIFCAEADPAPCPFRGCTPHIPLLYNLFCSSSLSS